ncbi:MAG TPA: cytochrome c maturation protein CcmE, partial [Gemmatimonadales bacterium]|nr:cytochrome c maturation protein CcmE [Gemmatimonadales bacterium]
MKAGTKFALGAVLIVGSVGYLMASGIKQTGQYFLTPSELAQRVAADPSFYDLGLKVGARVVKGTVSRETATQTLRFHITDGTVNYPVVFKGLPPDTFTDSVEVVVEGRL